MHWSFDNKYHLREPLDFEGELLESLKQAYKKESQPEKNNELEIEYIVLPNYMNGYNRSNKGILVSGKLKIRRSNSDDNKYKYHVLYTNKTTGEELSLDYRTKNNASRSLIDEWSIQTENSAGDLYQSIDMRGEIIELGKELGVELTVNERLKFISGKLKKGSKLTCNWSLFDCLAESAAQNCGLINLLDDLEKVKLNCRLTAYEDTSLDIKNRTLNLNGYILHGPGEVPSYWWLDGNNQVAIMSNVLNTFVLKGIK